MRTGDFRNSFVKGPPKSALAGPILAAATYPDVLVAKAFSRGQDLELVLHNGKAPGPQRLGIERLKAGATYRVTGAVVPTLTADAQGRAALSVQLDGRTAVRLDPVELH